MNEYALVLNAGSSSLKFCVFGKPADGAWALSARGQIEGIGTSPRFTAKDDSGAELARKALPASVTDGRPRSRRWPRGSAPNTAART
jgi:acetate kinase